MGAPEDLHSEEDVRCIRETSQAILCEVDGKEIWFPKSAIHDNSEVFEEGNEGTLVISQWAAEEKGLV